MPLVLLPAVYRIVRIFQRINCVTLTESMPAHYIGLGPHQPVFFFFFSLFFFPENKTNKFLFFALIKLHHFFFFSLQKHRKKEEKKKKNVLHLHTSESTPGW